MIRSGAYMEKQEFVAQHKRHVLPKSDAVCILFCCLCMIEVDDKLEESIGFQSWICDCTSC